MAALPADLRAVMQPVTKYTDNTANGGGNVQTYVTATTDYLFLLAEFEVFGTRSYANSYEQNYQAQYDYYKAGNSRVAYNHSAVSLAVWWWLRSPITTATIISRMSPRMATATLAMPITVLVCGPALPPNPPQDDPAPSRRRKAAVPGGNPK
ncbi:MAG: DUF6273 domain-containing protein [Clostridia bacterium]